MSTHDILIYGIICIVGWMGLMGGFYIASHIWMKRITKKYIDETSAERHKDAEDR